MGQIKECDLDPAFGKYVERPLPELGFVLAGMTGYIYSDKKSYENIYDFLSEFFLVKGEEVCTILGIVKGRTHCYNCSQGMDHWL